MRTRLPYHFFPARWLVAVALTLVFAAGAAAAQKIHLLESIELGGLQQTILIRGQDTTKPILLFLHGGPGVPEMPISYVNRALERDFVVVQWDQRGAGKSYHPGIPVSEMRLENYVQDTLQLSRYLLRRFHQPKLFLVGWSWGTLVGANAAKQAPELFQAYVGISQFVNVKKSALLIYQETLERARAQGNYDAWATVKALGPPPLSKQKDKHTFAVTAKKLVIRHVRHSLTPLHYAALALLSPDYSFCDDFRLVRGMRFTAKATAKDLYHDDISQMVREIKVPVYFFEGRYDTILSPILSERYFRELRAPRGKHLVWFEHSDHALHMEERQKYWAEMREVLRENPLTPGKPGVVPEDGLQK
jgi:pimeloyl-ACP methyl ester carboxylesterase